MKLKLVFIIWIITITATLAQPLETVVQRGHGSVIKALAFSPDGKYLASGSRDKTIKLWELSSGREIRTFLGHTSTVNGISFSPDGKYFASSSADKTAKIWDVVTGKVIKTLEGHKDYLTDLDYSPDGKYLVTAGHDLEAKLWDIAKEKVIKTFKVNPDKGLGYGVTVQISPDGKYLATGNDNHTTIIYDINSGEVVHEFKKETGWCGGCATFVDFNKGSDQLLTSSNNGPLKIWNLKTGKTLKALSSLKKAYVAIDFHPDGQHALMANEDSVMVWDTNSAQEVLAFASQHKSPITDAAYSPDGKYIATSSDDKTIMIRDSKSGVLIQTLQSYLNRIDLGGLDYDPNSYWDRHIRKYTQLKNEIRLSPDGKHVLKGKIGNIARMWELSSGKIVQEFRGHEKAVLCFEFSPDGKQIITGSADNTARLWDVQSGKALKIFKGHREVIFGIAFSADGKKLVTGSWDGTAKIWDIASGSLLDTFTFKNDSPYTLAFYREGLYLITAGLGKTLKMWEVDTKKEVRKFVGHNDIVQAIDFDPVSGSLISAGWDGFVKGWDIASGLLKFKLDGHQGAVHAVRYDPSGKYLATGGSDRTVRVWNTATGNEIKKMEGHQATVTSVNFTPDSKYLVSGSEDGILKVWSLETGKELFTHILIGDADWMVKNQEGYFNATDGAMKSIAFVRGMKSYALEQFFEEFYNPKLLSGIFSKTTKSNKTGLLEKLKGSPPPEIEIISPTQGEAQSRRQIDVLVKATNTGGGVNEIKLLHNGKAVPLTDKTGLDKLSKGKSIYKTYKLTLVPGRNIITASAFSEQRIESNAVKVTVRFGDDEVLPSLYVLAVGINEYKNPNLNLNYARADANGFAQLIKERTGKLFEKVEIETIYDEEATREHIFKKLEALSNKTSPEDVFFFYFAGHGSLVDGNFYFVTTDNVRLYQEDKLKKRAINAASLQEKLKQISALKQLVIVDACQSGGAVELLAQRGAAEEKALAQLSRSAGVHVLSAAGSEQFATEFAELGHGLFTYVLLEALKGKADGVPEDSRVTIYELKSYLDNKVPELSQKYKGKVQYPYTFSRGHDFPIVID